MYTVKSETNHLLKFSLIIPTYNESKNISTITKRICNLLDEAIPNQYELIIVDDDSPDKTWKVTQGLTENYPSLEVIRRRHQRGLATAVIRGWQAARGQLLGVIDGDLQHPPELLLKLLAAIDKGADLAIASRYIENGGVSSWNLRRYIISRGAQLIGLALLPSVVRRISDPLSGYFIVCRRAIAERPLNPIGYKILIEILARGNISHIREVGYVFQERRHGARKATWKVCIEYIIHLLRLRFSL